VLPPPVPRDVVDHALARRALLQQVLHGGLLTRTSPDDVCDASPELVRSAEQVGGPVEHPRVLQDRDRGEGLHVARLPIRTAGHAGRLSATGPGSPHPVLAASTKEQ